MTTIDETELLDRLPDVGEAIAGAGSHGSLTAYAVAEHPEVLTDAELTAHKAGLRAECLRLANLWLGLKDADCIERVERVNAEPAFWRIHGAAGSATVTSTMLSEFARTRPRILEATNAYPERLMVAGKPKAWPPIARVLMNAAEQVAAEDLTAAGRGLAFVQGRDHSFTLKVDDHAEGLDVASYYRIGATLYVESAELLTRLRRSGEVIDGAGLATCLRAAGGVRSRRRDSSGRQRTVWGFKGL